MPELPEVEVIRQGLQKHLPGRHMAAVKTSHKKLRLPVPTNQLKQYILGARVSSVDRRAKYLLIRMDNGATMAIHLGMSGRLGIFPPTAPLKKHDHLRWQLDDSNELRFNDSRRFGSVQVLAPGETLEDRIPGIGPEPLGPEFTAVYLKEKARGKKQPIKNFLMDGRIVVGIGNIYACETLFRAAIKPTTMAGRLGVRRWQKIVDAAQAVLQDAIASGGTTINDFVNASGKTGYFQLELQVYGRERQPCNACKTPITKKVMAGRSTFFCPVCQK
ncbi:MAG: bifunctional DNA-formamidopyrimidine glycosylase/DNA-(apurinic or apyrimidinic site) lyase [Proteobacteria bacterium]|nr:bifunctional DNA-formamidopyrimidine glycosylase/DNA-(apurinic or apyrimidinic site) lyase [Pseudomonadota bacterium]